MKSDVCLLTEKDPDSLKKVLTETEKAAKYASLNKKESNRLRLLAEELFEMIPSVLEFSSGEFWIECENKKFELHTSLKPTDLLTMEKREEILKVSSSGKNAAAKGIMAKIKLAATFMMIEYESNPDLSFAGSSFFDEGLGVNPYFSLSSWSLTQYRKKAQEEKGEKWDELEKSIIANIADDVIVGIQGKQVDIIVKKDF